MSEINFKMGIIGGGNMGEAFVGAVIKAGLFNAESVIVSDVSEERLQSLQDTYGVAVRRSNFETFDASQVVILAVKPQQMNDVLSGIAKNEQFGARERKLIISIAAGVKIEKIEKLLYAPLDEPSRKKLPIIRVMPNTPALVLAGVSGMSANENALEDEIELSRKILSSMGEVLQLEEKFLNAVTGVSGSGPAYVFYLIESMMEAGEKLGLSRQHSKKLTLNTIKGAVKLMEIRKESASELRRKVTSPGGTTEAALKVFEENDFRRTIIQAISAAAKRAAELSE